MSHTFASPNIAFIKYWGKVPSTNDEDLNLATNASLSMTLSRAKTECHFEFLGSGQHSTMIVQDALASPTDSAKIQAHVSRVCKAFGVAPDRPFSVMSSNNFPQGTGLASSASAFAALTLAVSSEILGRGGMQEKFSTLIPTLSALARRGSGSASRSLSGPYMKWEGASAHVFPASFKLRDTILIFSKEHKKVPSSEGHKSAQSSPHFKSRLDRLPARLKSVEEALLKCDLPSLGELLETEALELHEIAKSGNPSIEYLLPESHRFLSEIAKLKERDFFFTLDAGPNVHLISEKRILPDLERLLAKLNLKCEIWEDEQGFGPQF